MTSVNNQDSRWESYNKGKYQDDGRTSNGFPESMSLKLGDDFRGWIQGLKNQQYHNLLERFITHSNEKTVLAEYLRTFVKKTGSELFIDLGAGDGNLTDKLADMFANTVAVEKNECNCYELEQIPGVEVVNGSIQNFHTLTPYNLALFAYSITGVPDEDLKDVLTRLDSAREENGKLVVATFTEDSPWAKFVTEVREELGIKMLGSVQEQVERIEEAGFETVNHTELSCGIWGHDVKDLAHNLAFFFHANIASYIDNLDYFAEKLEKYISVSPDRVGITLYHQVFEIVNFED